MTRLNPAQRQAVIDRLVEKMNSYYIFPDQAAAFETAMREQIAAGAYQQTEDLHALMHQLTDALQAATHDRHLRVEYDPGFFEQLVQAEQAGERPPEYDEDEADPRFLQYGVDTNFGFECVERLRGNIGYIKLNGFFDAEYGGATAVAAMALVANTAALIFDLRSNGGGAPSMIQLLTSFLFNTPKHLNNFYARHSDQTRQFWTQAYVPGKRMAKTPVYVLTSRQTFSAAEEFTYNLKNLKRATIIGETTGGGAHPVTPMPLTDGLIVALCAARAVNPITKTNWEGTGIEPHIAVPADEALAKAHTLALENLLEQNAADEDKTLLDWHLMNVRAHYQPLPLTEAALKRFTGTFGDHTFAVQSGVLTLTHHGFTARLYPLSATTFANPTWEFTRFEFVGDEGGVAQELHLRNFTQPDVIVMSRLA